MDKIFKDFKKAQKAHDFDIEAYSESMYPSPQNNQNNISDILKKERQLSLEEKKFLLAAERGDIATVKYYLDEASNFEKFNANAVDPLGRSAIHIAIEYENIEMIELLLNYHVDLGEALLHAINEEFVEAVEMLLHYQDNELNNGEKNNQSSEKYEKIINTDLLKTDDQKEQEIDLSYKYGSKSFTSDITPLILAAHKDNYEIIKILLDRGEQIPEPHDVRCSCHTCISARSEDSLKYSKSRVNAYKALASPSLISLSSKDPILTAFQLSWELKRLSKIENEFKFDYEKLSQQCQEYASALLAETRTSQELEIILNYDHENPPALFENEKEKTNLSRLKLAIKYKQKKFVAHPHCQQLLVSLWYDGISGYRRRNIVVKILVITFITLIFPFLSILYMIMPRSKVGKILRQPFIKFICHSASYITFLFLLIMVSLRINSFLTGMDDDDNKEKRGPPPTNVEWIILLYVTSFIWSEIKQLYTEGVIDYLHNWWNLLDFITNSLYITTLGLKVISYSLVQNEMISGKETYKLNREKWDPWDPTLISEGIFACANVFSALKIVYIFTINPQLGPLIISLGRMIFDIMKLIVIMFLVLFSFCCGLNQLYWYYAQIRNKECQTKYFNTIEERDECTLKFKYFSNLFEALQTLIWGIFGMVEKDRLETLFIKHTFTMFIGLLMFGVYCTIMIIVLINMLIAMMSNSYEIIANQADEEWKFARSKLWISYFEEGGTLPAPFNIIPTPKSIYYIFNKIFHKVCCFRRKFRKQQKWLSVRKVVKRISEREARYQSVVRELVKRYIMKKQQRDLNDGITEDDLNEIKQDISGLRFELLEIFKKNDYNVDVKQNPAKRKRGKLNIEKAMSKKLFDDDANMNNSNNKLFDQFKLNDKNTINTISEYDEEVVETKKINKKSASSVNFNLEPIEINDTNNYRNETTRIPLAVSSSSFQKLTSRLSSRFFSKKSSQSLSNTENLTSSNNELNNDKSKIEQENENENKFIIDDQLDPELLEAIELKSKIDFI